MQRSLISGRGGASKLKFLVSRHFLTVSYEYLIQDLPIESPRPQVPGCQTANMSGCILLLFKSASDLSCRLGSPAHPRTIELHSVTLTHTPLQNIYNVLTFKRALEEKKGEIDAKTLSEMYNKM